MSNIISIEAAVNTKSRETELKEQNHGYKCSLEANAAALASIRELVKQNSIVFNVLMSLLSMYFFGINSRVDYERKINDLLN